MSAAKVQFMKVLIILGNLDANWKSRVVNRFTSCCLLLGGLRKELKSFQRQSKIFVTWRTLASLYDVILLQCIGSARRKWVGLGTMGSVDCWKAVDPEN